MIVMPLVSCVPISLYIIVWPITPVVSALSFFSTYLMNSGGFLCLFGQFIHATLRSGSLYRSSNSMKIIYLTEGKESLSHSQTTLSAREAKPGIMSP